MKKILLALVLAGGVGAAAAANPEVVQTGTVESVHEIPLIDSLQGVFVHSVRPRTVDEVVIRIDNGGAVVLRQEEMRRFAPGQRVRLVMSTAGPRVEWE